jgi:amino acid adenylation domain-containing protein
MEGFPPAQQRIRATCYHSSGTFVPFPIDATEQSVPDRFEQQVQTHGHRLAVKMADQALTYDELNRMANRIAHAILGQRGAAPEPVALLFAKGIQEIAAYMGVLKAGKFYVPLDPSYPHDRIAFMLHDAQSHLIVTNTHGCALLQHMTHQTCPVLNVDTLLPGGRDDNPGLSLTPDALAYVIYTSGSTGQPKGVMQTHRNVLHKVLLSTNTAHFCPEDRLTSLASPSSSSTVWDVYCALCNGASVHAFDVKLEPMEALKHWLHQDAITYANFVPSVFRQLCRVMHAGEIFTTLRGVYLGAETVSPGDVELYKIHCRPDCVLVTSLGSTEAGNCCRYFIDKATPITDGVVPVGYELPDKEVLLLDEDGHEVGVNQIGEIVVRSRFLSPGYWRQPALTQAKFLPDPEGGDKRLYHTGDLGRRRADGCVIHVGREDFQIKVRGQRVDVSEIQAALLQLDVVKEAIVIQRQDEATEPRLVAYLVPAHQPLPTMSSLRRALATSLASYMIPSAFVWVDTLPLTPAGKLDRRALPAPGRSRPLLDTPYAPPRTPIEEALVRLWQALLALDEVGIHDHFLDLGGHSLLATQVITQVVQTFQVELPVRTLFETPTIAEMAVVIAQHQAEKVRPDELARLLAEVESLSQGHN